MPTANFQPSFAAGVLGPGLHGRIDIAKYDVGLRLGHNVFIHAHGGVSNRAGTEFVGEVMDHTKLHRLIPFRRDADQNVVMLMGELQMKVVEDGAFVQSGGSDYVAVTPYTAAQVQTLNYVQSVDVMFMAEKGVFPQRMERLAPDNFTFANIAIDPNLTAPGAPSVASANAGTETYRYKVAPVTDEVEGFPSAFGEITTAEPLRNAGAKNTVTWSSTGADEYYIYKERNGIYGYIGFTDGLSFDDDNIDADLTTTPVEAAGLFSTADDYPSVTTLFQQRLMLGGSTNEPETLFGSRIGDFANFTRSRILRAADRIRIDLTGQSLNTIKGLIQIRELLLFTASGEFSVTGPDGTLTADNPIQTQYGYSGSTALQPLVVEDTALFVDRTGRNVRDLRYAFEQDGYSGNDLTIFASHFFEGKRFVAWDFAKNPYSIVWAATDDGALYSLTYKREHQVWAWTEHDVGGAVESLAVVPEGNTDALYLVVNRTINGATKRYVERMAERQIATLDDAFFVDSGVRYTGAATTTITGLAHLEGEAVVALADGDVVQGLTVSGGQITLPKAAANVVVGLPYTSQIETLPPAVDVRGIGNARGRPHRVSNVRVQLEKTRGIRIGGAGRKTTEIQQTGPDLAEAISTFTGMVTLNIPPDWNTDGTVYIEQTYPLPMTILGISPELSIGRGG